MLGKQNLYEQDFYAWTFQQADLLKQGKFEQVDLSNIIEEIETLGRNLRNAIASRMVVLIAHLLKWKFQPNFRETSHSWLYTIKEQRVQIQIIIDDMPSLKNSLKDDEWINKQWKRSLMLASDETKLKQSIFPSEPIWSVEQILDENFYPNDENQ